MLRPLRWIYCAYAVLSFCILLLLIFPMVLAAAAFGRLRGGNAITKLCRFWGDVWLPIIGIYHQNIYEAAIEKNKQYVFVANHHSYMDIPVIFQGIRNKNFRILAKVEMSKIPVFGFLYRYATVMVDRNDALKRAKSIRQLKAFMRKNISVFIYPEGTFNTTTLPLKSFYDGAFRLAIETGAPIKPIVFLDTAKRLHHSTLLSLKPGRSRAVILPEISVDGLGLENITYLKEKTFIQMESCILKYRNMESNQLF